MFLFAIVKKQTTYFHQHPQHKIYILIGGDRGSSYIKIHFKIVAPGIVSSAHDLHSYIRSVLPILKKQETYFHGHPEHKVNILIGGDRSGSYTTFHFKIVAPGIVSSAYNVHILAMFEALDSRQNMLNHLEPSESPIENMQHKDFTLCGGCKVKAFLDADFKMLDLAMGH